MKKILAIVLCLMMCCAAVCAFATETETSESSTSPISVRTDLSPDNKCPMRPTVYSTPRYYNTAANKAYDLDRKKGLSAKTINNETGDKLYGLYLKLTPGGKDVGYTVKRFDIVVKDSDGRILYTDGFDSDLTCKNGYYFVWNFFPLEGLYNNMKQLYGEVIPGNYNMDVYINELWAGNAGIRINP